MTKLIKMSLVAAVAVAGLSSTVAAKPLEEAIKNVDVSGMIRLRFDAQQNDTDATDTTSDFDTDITFKSKISDDSTAVIKIEGDKNVDTDDSTSSRLTVNMSLAYLSTKFDATTVSVGRQGIPGPFDDAQGGDGIIASTPIGSLTAVGGFFTTTSIAGVANGKDAYELALLGQAGPVAFDIFYANVSNVVALTSLHASANIEGITIDARHTVGTLDGDIATDDKDASLTKIVATGNAGMVNFLAGFAFTGEDNDANNGANRIALDDDADAGSDLIVEQASIGGLSDAKAVVVGAGVTVNNVDLGAKYVYARYDDANDDKTTADEYLIEASYPLDTNLVVSGIYSVYDSGASTDDNDQTFTRLEVKYTF